MKNIYNKTSNIFNKAKNVFNLQKILIFILLVLFFSLSWTYYSFIKSTKLTFNNVKSSEIKNIRTISLIIEKSLKYDIKRQNIPDGFSLERTVEVLGKSAKLRKELNGVLSLFITKTIRYVYIIYKDDKGAYRYLLDGSLPLSERGAFKQIFIPVNAELWHRCFKTKKDVYGVQNKNNKIVGLWVTYLHPIIYKNSVQAVLALDVSSNTYSKLEDILAPSRHYLKYMIIFISITIFCIFVETLLLFREQRKRRIDPLTGLYNRSYLKEFEKNVDLRKIAVAVVDIDFFKKINDTYGHDYGDLALKNVAKKLMLYTRDYDVIIRYGGEEFVVIFKNYYGYKSKKAIRNIVKVTKRIQRKISLKPMRLDNVEINITVSIGIDPFTFKRESLNESITMADKALYIAKQTGRNRVVSARFNDKDKVETGLKTYMES